MSDNLKEQKFLSELDGDLHEAVCKVRNVAVDELAVQQSVSKMQQLVDEAVAGNGNLRPKATSMANTIKWVGGIAASALIAFGIFTLVSQPKLSLAAQVARAIAAEDWVRAIESFTDGGEMETWFSTARNISALSNSERVEYRDHDEGVSYEFFRKDQTIYCVSESEFSPQYSKWSKLVTRLPMLLADGLPDEPVTTIFGEGVGERITFVGQNIAPSPDGHELEYAIQCLLDDSPMEIVLFLDPETKLPLRCLMTGILEGKEMTNTIELDYPDSGPRNIYDLGVPMNAKLVNRIETDQEKFLLDAVKAGITNFDDYRAIMVKHRIGDKLWWRNAHVEVVCRKGECFTRSYVRIFVRSKIEPDKDADMHAWWEKQIELSEEDPNGRLMNLAIGDQIWAVDFNDGTFEKRHANSYLFASLRPDMLARPLMGGSSPRLEIRIDENPKTGPPGTILFELYRADGPGVSRFWIDPERGYLVVQMEDGTDEEWSHQTIVEKAAKSPSGIWYPERLSTKSKRSDGEMYKEETNCYVDFEAELPDKLFKVK